MNNRFVRKWLFMVMEICYQPSKCKIKNWVQINDNER